MTDRLSGGSLRAIKRNSVDARLLWLMCRLLSRACCLCVCSPHVTSHSHKRTHHPRAPLRVARAQVGFMCASDMCSGGATPSPPAPNVLLRQPGAFVEVCTNETAASAAGWHGVVTIGGGPVDHASSLASVQSGKQPSPPSLRARCASSQTALLCTASWCDLTELDHGDPLSG